MRKTRSDYERPETIEETAELVTKAGGEGIAVAVDYFDRYQVAGLIERISSDHARLDVLINNIGGMAFLEFGKTIWEHDLDRGLKLLHAGLETHLVAAHYALPLLIRNKGGLIVEVGDGKDDFYATRARASVFYDVTKTAMNRLAFLLGREVEPFGGTAVALTPGWLRSEMMLDVYGVAEANWRDATRPRSDGKPHVPGFGVSETPRYVGRAIAAIASDPDRARWNQGSVTVAELAAEYGFTDIDGSRPDAWRYLADADVDETTDPADYR